MTESVPLAGVPFANVEEIVVGIESDGHAGWCFQPMAEGIRCVVVGKVVIPAMHARLIFYGPWQNNF